MKETETRAAFDLIPKHKKDTKCNQEIEREKNWSPKNLSFIIFQKKKNNNKKDDKITRNENGKTHCSDKMNQILFFCVLFHTSRLH